MAWGELTYWTIVIGGLFMLEIYLKPKAYSNIQLKKDGVYWKSVWGRTYVYFPWSEIRQAGFADGISMTNKVKDIDEAMKESLRKRGDTAVYISTRNIEDRKAMEKALEVTAKKGRGLLDMLEKDSEKDVYFICFEARAKKKEEIKQEILQYMDESKWARPMDIEGHWKES